MASATITADKTTAVKGDRITFAVAVLGLRAPTSRTAVGHVDVLLDDGSTVSADSAAVTITTPGQRIASTTVTFDGRTLTPNADGTFTATA
jgi:hypothetical protein